MCGGQGFVELHPAALSMYDPAVVSEAVALILEATARTIDSVYSLTDDRRGRLAAQVSELLAARIISPPLPRAAAETAKPAAVPLPSEIPPARRRKKKTVDGQSMLGETPEMLAESTMRVTIAPYDMAVLNAAPHTYAKTDRPLMRGLPVLSAAGHPSHLARIEDPQDAYGSTGEDAQRRATRSRQARVLAAAVPMVRSMKVGS